MMRMVARVRRRICAASPVLLLAAASLGLSGCNGMAVELSSQEKTELGQRALDLLIRAAQSDLDVVAANAIESLVQVGPHAGRSHFRTGTRSDSPMVRYAACIALGETRNAGAINDIARCQRDRDEHVRLAATYAAYRCGESDPQPLFAALDGHADETVRTDAAYLIGRMGEKQAIARLKRFTSDKSNKVVVQVWAAMAALGDKSSLEQLILYAQGDVISRMVALQELAALGREEARECLMYRMGPSEDYLEARLIAARGLGKLGSKAGFDLALKQTRFTAKDETDQMRVRTLAALALGAIGDARALSALQTLAESNDERVQVAACCAICQIVGPVAQRAPAETE